MNNSNSKATASLVLGILSLIAWLLPIAGYPISIIGIVFGAKNLKSEQSGMATAGLILSIIGLCLCVINSALGAYMGASGQLF